MSFEFIEGFALIIEAKLEEGISLSTKVVDYLQCKIPIATCSARTGVLNDLYFNEIIDYFSVVENPQSIFIMLKKWLMTIKVVY